MRSEKAVIELGQKDARARSKPDVDRQARQSKGNEGRSVGGMIDVRDVTKVFRMGENQVEALRGVTFHLDTGTCVFIVGPSGSGKSTLLTLLGALDRPTTGKIEVEGLELTALSERDQDTFRHDHVGFIFQNFNLIANLSAIDNVLTPFLPSGSWAPWGRKATDLLTQLGLGNRLSHRPYQLSGGQQQRVAIARAVIKDPFLILADEPTGELDSKSGDEIFQLLRHHQSERGCTLIVVTHDRRFISPDDLVIELEDGQVVNGAVSVNGE
jgi:putative ABC transport system ATP-binding protein